MMRMPALWSLFTTSLSGTLTAVRQTRCVPAREFGGRTCCWLLRSGSGRGLHNVLLEEELCVQTLQFRFLLFVRCDLGSLVAHQYSNSVRMGVNSTFDKFTCRMTTSPISAWFSLISWSRVCCSFHRLSYIKKGPD